MAINYNVALIGFMGSGKTAVSESLREQFDMDVIDMDAEIERRAGMSISNIFLQYGEEYFRNLETELLKDLSQEENIVISCGGGAVLRKENVDFLKEGGKVVYLQAKPQTIYDRIKNTHNRPLLEGNMSVENIADMMDGRRDKYEAAADIIVDVDGKTVEEIGREIIDALNKPEGVTAGKEGIDGSSFIANDINGATKLYGLIGSPVAHSGSPIMYNTAFGALGINSAYMAFDVDEAGVADAMNAMKIFNMGGMNVTMPCKNEVVKYMDELSDAARLMGAVNTIVNDDGKLIGHNTDGCGFVGNLRDNGVDVVGKKIVICGAGGAATAIIVQCALDGAREISIFKRVNATFNTTVELADKIMSEQAGVTINVYDIADDAKMVEEMLSADIFVNGTSVGMHPSEEDSIVKDARGFHENLVVCDIVYNPLETKLLQDAANAGVKQCIGGKGMLLWQGVEAFKLYTGQNMPVNIVKKKLGLD